MKVLTYADISSEKEVRLVGKGDSEIVPALVAWQKADEAGMNLIQVSTEDIRPMVCRIQDFNKLMFEKKKTKQAQKKKKKSELKEIQLKANISLHDLETKVRSIDKFLERGDKVKVVIRLKGRERDHPERATELMDKVITLIKSPNKFSKMAGPITAGILEPAK